MRIIYYLAILLAFLKIIGVIDISWTFIVLLPIINYVLGMIIAGKPSKFK